jgi:hypothetical protein
MLLSASPSLFDDPAARVFLEQVERLSVTMLRATRTPAGQAIGTEDRQRLDTEMKRLTQTAQPLLIRIPPEERALLEGESRA